MYLCMPLITKRHLSVFYAQNTAVGTFWFEQSSFTPIYSYFMLANNENVCGMPMGGEELALTRCDCYSKLECACIAECDTTYTMYVRIHIRKKKSASQKKTKNRSIFFEAPLLQEILGWLSQKSDNNPHIPGNFQNLHRKCQHV